MKFEEAFISVSKVANEGGSKVVKETARAAAFAWNVIAYALANGGLEDAANILTTQRGEVIDIKSMSLDEFKPKPPVVQEVEDSEDSEDEEEKPKKEELKEEIVGDEDPEDEDNVGDEELKEEESEDNEVEDSEEDEA